MLTVFKATHPDSLNVTKVLYCLVPWSVLVWQVKLTKSCIVALHRNRFLADGKIEVVQLLTEVEDETAAWTSSEIGLSLCGVHCLSDPAAACAALKHHPCKLDGFVACKDLQVVTLRNQGRSGCNSLCNWLTLGLKSWTARCKPWANNTAWEQGHRAEKHFDWSKKATDQCTSAIISNAGRSKNYWCCCLTSPDVLEGWHLAHAGRPSQ